MNDKRLTHITRLAIASLLITGCSQEEITLSDASEDNVISFHTSLPGIETRSDHNVDGNLIGKNGFYVTAFAREDETTIGSNKKLNEYFSEKRMGIVTDGTFRDGSYRNESCKWPEKNNVKKGELKFFAFYPSREELRERAGADASYFVLGNASTTTKYSYSMEKFKINKDISKHTDFVTAVASGTKSEHLISGVNLVFEHQLSRIDLQAWGAPSAYEVEIAGVRIGNVNIESKFDFSQTQNSKTDNTTNGKWITPQTKGIVEYIYREGDKVISIGRTEDTNTTAPKAISIMGNGGPAIVIPGTYSTNWSTTAKAGFYYSVLIRVNDKEGKLLYPYIEGANMNSSKKTDEMNVVYLSVEKSSGLVKKRVYKKEGIYYTSDKLSAESIYNVPIDEEVRNYGWAAIPTSIPSSNPWKAGYQYTIKLGYSSGVGVMDPDDVFPGKPIISEISSGVTVTSFKSTTPVDVSDIITIDPE